MKKKLNQKLKNVFESMKEKKVILLIIMFLGCVFFAGDKKVEVLIAILFSMFVAVIVNIIIHDENVIVPLCVFGGIILVSIVFITFFDLENSNGIIILFLSNLFCSWLTALFINNEVNKRN